VLGWCLAVDERVGGWSLGALGDLAETRPAIGAAGCSEAWERARLEALPPEKLAVALRDRASAPLARAVGIWAEDLLAAASERRGRPPPGSCARNATGEVWRCSPSDCPGRCFSLWPQRRQ